MKRFLVLLILLLSFLTISFSQIKDIGLIPYVKNYSVEEYKGSAQIWNSIQDEKGIMYFASNVGILQFDGRNWQKISVPNEVVRSFNIDQNGKIFVGCKNEFGYLYPDKSGTLEYTSLLNLLPDSLQNCGNVWDIFITQNDGIYFHTYDAFYHFKDNAISYIPVENDGLFVRGFYIDDKIYVHDKGAGLELLEKEKTTLIPNSEIFADEMIKGILQVENKLLIISWSQGIFEYDGKKFNNIISPIDDFIKNDIYKIIPIKDEYFAFGLNTSGLLITDTNLNPVQYMNSDCGLQNNAIRNIYLDTQDNLWLCTENGISSVPLFDPFTKFGETYGLKDCRTYSALKFENRLYVGTTSGLYYKDWTKHENKISGNEEFGYIKNSEGNIQAYYLDIVDNKIFVASNLGLYKVNSDSADYILKNRGVRIFINPKDNKNQIIAGTDVLLSFKKNENKWQFDKNIAGFENYSRYIEEDQYNYLWMTNTIKGVFKIELNQEKDSVVKYTLYNAENGLHGLPSHLDNYVFNSSQGILFGTTEGIYKYDYENDLFFPYDELNQVIDEKIAIVMIKEDLNGNIWYKDEKKDKDNITIWELGVLLKTENGYVKNKTPFYKYRNKIYSFDYIDENTYVIGAEHGFVHYDATVKKNYFFEYPALIRKVQLIKNDSIVFGGSFINASGNTSFIQEKSDIIEFPYELNDLRFTYSATYFDEPEKLRFKYYLEGNDDDWSDWKDETTKEYSNLKSGEYTFYVKAKNIYEVESSIAEYNFVIKPPWYITIWAYLLYFVVAAFIVYLIINIYTARLRKEKERLERIVAERTAEIREKNAELEQQKEEILAQRDLLHQHNEEIIEKNKNITSSITYAKRIQDAMLPLESVIQQHLENHFILFKPRDIVSGDFYWFSEKEGKIIFTAVDCTGHGVPGAFMSMIGAEILTTIVNKGFTDAAEILNQMNLYVRNALKQDTTDNQDGMDLALCVIDKENKTVEFSGAKNPLVYIHNDELFHLKGNKQAIGGHQIKSSEKFQNQLIKYTTPTYFYMFSDGFPDQFGGKSGRKFMIKNLKNLLLEIHKLPMQEQKKILDDTIMDWMKLVEQTDDIIVTGFML